MQSSIANNCLKVSTDGHSEPHFVPKLLLHVYVQELQNSMVSSPEEGVPKDARDPDNTIIISDSKLRSVIPPQLKNMSAQYNVMCGCECCISAKSIHSSLLSWCDHYLRKLNDLSQNTQNRRSGKKDNRLFETYKTL